MCAARMAEVDENSSRNCASETPAWLVISANPIDSKGALANSVKKAATIFSRSVPGAAGAAVLAARDDRGARLDLRAMRANSCTNGAMPLDDGRASGICVAD